MAYPNLSEKFVMYTNKSKRQLDAVSTHYNRPMSFFEKKLSGSQKDIIAKLELLTIVETVKDFKSMLFGQKVEVFTDHSNLTRDALAMTSDRVYRWRLLTEEYGLKSMYIKGVDNTVAGAITRLDYTPSQIHYTYINNIKL